MILHAIVLMAAAVSARPAKPVLVAGYRGPVQQKIVDKKFIVAYSVLGAAKAADLWTTAASLGKTCWETDPIYGGPGRPSDKRLALTGLGYFSAEVALGYGLKRFGRNHRWAKWVWVLEPAIQSEQHLFYATHGCGGL